MKKKWSSNWNSSKQPRKQRKFRYNAPLHVRQSLVAATLDKKLRKEFGKRSLSVRRGDEVLVMRGSFKGKIGKVSSVDLRESKVYIETVKRKKVSGQEIEVPVDPSNLKIVRLYMEDKKRRKFFERKKTKVEKKKEK